VSLRRHILNAQLRLLEKPRLARAGDPAALRLSFERQARFWFRMPRGTALTDASRAGMAAIDLAPEGCDSGAVIFYIHGGGFVFGSPRTHAAMIARLAGQSGTCACLPAYRRAPEDPFPAALDDVTAAYGALLDAGTDPARIVIGGDSAGGALALSLLARLIRRDMPRPAGLFAFSPLTDLTFSGGSFTANARREALLPAQRAADMAEMYLRGADPRDPRASPLFADFQGAPPVWLTCGDSEILCDDTRRIADRLRAQGVDVTCDVQHDLPHVWPIFQGVLPEADATLRDLAGWIRRRLPSAGN
jgi:acetyl esterase/lipase